MKAFNQGISQGFKFDKLIHWSKLIVFTGSAQMFIQGITLISGIIIIRLLPTQEYAFYTLVNTMLGTMTVLSDGGISAGVMAQGGQVWQNPDKLGVVLITGFKLRKQFAIFSILISVPILFFLLLHHGAGWPKAILIVLALIPAFIAALSDSLLEIAPKLWQDIKQLQFNQVFVGLFRLLMTVTLYLFPFSTVAILAAGVPRFVGNLKLRRISAKYVNWNQEPDAEVRSEVLSIVKRSLPGAIYYCISGQITIWLISAFGSTQAIAHIGALSRLTTLLTVCTTLFSTLVSPRFARFKEEKKLLLSRFLQVQASLLLISAFIIAVVVCFPHQVLWILGKDYQNLSDEVILITISSCLTMLAGVTYSVAISRGWIIKPVINISLNIFFQLVLFFTMDLSKTKNVLMFSIVDYLLAYIILIIYFLYRIYKIKIKLVHET